MRFPQYGAFFHSLPRLLFQSNWTSEEKKRNSENACVDATFRVILGIFSPLYVLISLAKGNQVDLSHNVNLNSVNAC